MVYSGGFPDDRARFWREAATVERPYRSPSPRPDNSTPGEPPNPERTTLRSIRVDESPVDGPIDSTGSSERVDSADQTSQRRRQRSGRSSRPGCNGETGPAPVRWRGPTSNPWPARYREFERVRWPVLEAPNPNSSEGADWKTPPTTVERRQQIVGPTPLQDHRRFDPRTESMTARVGLSSRTRDSVGSSHVPDRRPEPAAWWEVP
jgi:hypothetical protein